MDYVTSLNGMFKNQNTTLLGLATNKGYRVYESYNFLQVSDDDDYQELIVKRNNYKGPLKIVQLLYESNVIVFVGTSENTNFPENQIIIWDDIKKRKIGVLMLKETVVDVKVSKTAIFAILRNKIVVFEILGLKYIFTVKDVNHNPKLISVTFVEDLTILAYTSLTKPEEIKILKVFNDKEGRVVERLDKGFYCFLPAIDRVVLSRKGDLAAVLSRGGHNVHIYSVNQYQLLFCLWRGKAEEEIVDVTFSKKNKFLCLVSAKGTLYIYALDPTKDNILVCHCHEIEKNEKNEHKGGLFSNVFSKVKNIFSSIKPLNSYAKYKLNNEENLGFNSILEDKINSIMVIFEKVNELIIVSSKGIVEKIKFNTKEGGYCWNYKTINWLSPQKRDLASTFE